MGTKLKCRIHGCRRKCSGARPVCNDHWWRLSDAARARYWNCYQMAVQDSPRLAESVAAIVDELGEPVAGSR